MRHSRNRAYRGINILIKLINGTRYSNYSGKDPAGEQFELRSNYTYKNRKLATQVTQSDCMDNSVWTIALEFVRIIIILITIIFKGVDMIRLNLSC